MSGGTAPPLPPVVHAFQRVYTLPEGAITRAGFFAALICGEYRDSKGQVALAFDDDNITRAAFECCLNGLSTGMLTNGTPPEVLLSVIATSLYLDAPIVTEQALNAIRSTLSPQTLPLILHFAAAGEVGGHNLRDDAALGQAMYGSSATCLHDMCINWLLRYGMFAGARLFGDLKVPSSTLHRVLTSDRLFAYSEEERRRLAADAVELRRSQRCPPAYTPLEADLLRSVSAPLGPLRFAFDFGDVDLLPYEERMYSPVHFHAGSWWCMCACVSEDGLSLFVSLERRDPSEALPKPLFLRTYDKRGQALLAGFFPDPVHEIDADAASNGAARKERHKRAFAQPPLPYIDGRERVPVRYTLYDADSAQVITSHTLLGTGERTWEDESLHMSMQGVRCAACICVVDVE